MKIMRISRKHEFIIKEKGFDPSRVATFLTSAYDGFFGLHSGRTECQVYVGDEYMIWYRVKGHGFLKRTYTIEEEVIIRYSDFKEAEFGKYELYIWLQTYRGDDLYYTEEGNRDITIIKDYNFVFGSLPSIWNLEASKTLVKKINEITPIIDIDIFEKIIK